MTTPTPTPAPRHTFSVGNITPTNIISVIETIAFVVGAVVAFVHGNNVLGTALVGATAHGINHP